MNESFGDQVADILIAAIRLAGFEVQERQTLTERWLQSSNEKRNILLFVGEEYVEMSCRGGGGGDSRYYHFLLADPDSVKQIEYTLAVHGITLSLECVE